MSVVSASIDNVKLKGNRRRNFIAVQRSERPVVLVGGVVEDEIEHQADPLAAQIPCQG
jgi:hypothetical protein